MSQCFSPQMNNWHPWQLKKIKILGAVLELPAKHWPICSNFEVNGLDWQCCLDGSSKWPPGFEIVSIAMGSDYSFDLKNIEIWAPEFFKHNNSSVATVRCKVCTNLCSEVKQTAVL